MSEPEPKRVRDRIRALPYAVLCHILLFLDKTEDAVRTCVLSKRLKDIWASVPSLVFIDDEENPDFVSFVRHVDNVLFFRDSTDIRKFHVQCNSVEDFRRIYGWIGTAIRRKVVELHLDLKDYGGDDDQLQVFKLPQSVFTCKTLSVLELFSSFIINPPASGCFPSLKSLNVQIDHPIDKSMEKFFSCCPGLEYLHIGGSHGWEWDQPILNINVSAPQLKTIKIYWHSHDVCEKRCKFHINPPKLENFHLWQDLPTDCFLENSKLLLLSMMPSMTILLKQIITLPSVELHFWQEFPVLGPCIFQNIV